MYVFPCLDHNANAKTKMPVQRYMTVADEDETVINCMNPTYSDSFAVPDVSKAHEAARKNSVHQLELCRRVKACRGEYERNLRDVNLQKAQEERHLRKVCWCESDHNPMSKK